MDHFFETRESRGVTTLGGGNIRDRGHITILLAVEGRGIPHGAGEQDRCIVTGRGGASKLETSSECGGDHGRRLTYLSPKKGQLGEFDFGEKMGAGGASSIKENEGKKC